MTGFWQEIGIVGFTTYPTSASNNSKGILRHCGMRPKSTPEAFDLPNPLANSLEWVGHLSPPPPTPPHGRLLGVNVVIRPF